MSRGSVLSALLPALLWLLAACGNGAASGPVERVTVPPGASFTQVTDSLVARGIVGSRLWFKLLARLKRVDRAVHAGVYEFTHSQSASSVLATLAAGRAVAVRLTVPEGLMIPEVAALAADRLGVRADSVVAAASDPREAAALGLAGTSLEGFLRPETYTVPIDITARELVRTMAKGFEADWQPEWNAQLGALGLTRLQLVTLASIVEGEARVDDERETIAGVYLNRLHRGMPLQADPTVQYAIYLKTGKRKSRLFEKDYLTPSPYNTYLNAGLPPGPVASPGRRSIIASLHPADVPYLFFVAGSDGRHIFTRTYNDHLRAIARIRNGK